MKRYAELSAVLVGLLLAFSCHKAEPALSIFDTRNDPAFGDAAPALRLFLDRRPDVAAGRLQHFCVVGLSPDPGGSKRAWVHWQEGNLLILWEGGDSPDQIFRSRRKLNLQTDVVASEADLRGSTYLVTRAWAGRVLSACQQSGAKYAVERTNG